MKPSEETERDWIRTRSQLGQAEKKQRSFNPYEVIRFLKSRGYDNAGFRLDLDRSLLIDKSSCKPLKLNEKLIDEIASKTGLVSGKWLIFVQREYVDEVWEKIEKMAEQEEIWSAKVSTSSHPSSKAGEHVICVYTKNYLDKQDVMEARETLRKIGIENELTYKPDIYTVLGIYWDNKEDFGIERVTRYSG